MSIEKIKHLEFIQNKFSPPMASRQGLCGRPGPGKDAGETGVLEVAVRE